MTSKQYKYLKISDRSGCISGSFKVKNTASEMVTIPLDEREISGHYKPYKIK